jgi:hypothetical protein
MAANMYPDDDSYILICNYGNDSIALIQWMKEANLHHASTLISVDTGWAAPTWHLRTQEVRAWAKHQGFKTFHLKSKTTFPDLMRHRGNFPTPQLQWCAGFLKGLPITEWLESPEGDPYGQATIVLAHRRHQSPKRADIHEYIESSEHYLGRTVWHPLLACSETERNRLIQKTPFDVLPHRALECDPCVNSDPNDWLRMDLKTLIATSMLEHALEAPLFPYAAPIQDLKTAVEALKHAGATWMPDSSMDRFDMGCGSPYGCGM